MHTIITVIAQAKIIETANQQTTYTVNHPDPVAFYGQFGITGSGTVKNMKKEAR